MSTPHSLPDERAVSKSGDTSAGVAQRDVLAIRPVNSIDYLGRRLVLLGLTPAGLFGIAVGATTVVLKLADASVHLAGLAIIWGAASVVSILAIIAGMREVAVYGRRLTQPGEPAEVKNVAMASEGAKPDEWPNAPVRYQSLKSLNPVDESHR